MSSILNEAEQINLIKYKLNLYLKNIKEINNDNFEDICKEYESFFNQVKSYEKIFNSNESEWNDIKVNIRSHMESNINVYTLTLPSSKPNSVDIPINKLTDTIQLLYKNCDRVRESASKVWKTINNILYENVDTMKTMIVKTQCHEINKIDNVSTFIGNIELLISEKIDSLC